LAGAVGFPVFAAGGGVAYLFGPTGGYLLAYPAAAFLVGTLMGTGRLRTLGALLAGLAAIYAGGLAWLAVWGTVNAAVALGLRPFLIADLVKVAQAYLVVRLLGERPRRLLG
ncbi:MAG: biotin transporter BioY, partial [Gemmatimonadota bacterium]|nr:biotin transporter BioY [Gemmatimonadota bacterium]